MKIVKYRMTDVSSKSEARKKIVKIFLNEACGSKNNVSRYEYNVEKYERYNIILKRPGRFKKGFDFTVNIRGMYFKKKRKYEAPSINDIVEALEYVKRQYPNKYCDVKKEINNIFKLKPYNLDSLREIFFEDFEMESRPIAIILLAIKWLFISEDIAYWNWSGRNMFMKILRDKHLA